MKQTMLFELTTYNDDTDRTKAKKLLMARANFKKRKILAVKSVLANFKVYDIIRVKGSKSKVMAIVLGDRVRVVMIDVKRRRCQSIFWMRDSTKIRKLPSTNFKKFPFILIVQWDFLQLRNLVNH